MSEIALTIGAGTRHQGRMEDGDAARGPRAIVRGFVESGASMFLIDRDDFVKQVVEDLRGEGFDVHVALADVTDEAQMVRAFAEIGEVWGNVYTLVNNARIITIKDLEPPASGILSASCNSGGGPSPNLRAGLPSAADTTEPGTELLSGIDEATRHPRRQAWAAAIDRSRTLPTTAHDLDISA